jgi:hypothetical protein
VTEAEFLAQVMHMGRDLDLLMHHAVNRCPGCGLVLPSGTPGFPDVVAIGPHGILLRELKTRTAILSPAQKIYARILDGLIVDQPHRLPLFDVWRPADQASGRIRRDLVAIVSPF